MGVSRTTTFSHGSPTGESIYGGWIRDIRVILGDSTYEENHETNHFSDCVTRSRNEPDR